MSVKVNIKWGKEELKDVEIDYSLPPVVFMTQIFSMTGVPIERQKIMVKGGMLKHDADNSVWEKIGLKNGQKIMMMGTAEVLVAPTKEITFVEDLPEEAQEYSDTAALGMGLVNMGNTCYLNATLQCLHNAPGLKETLNSYDPSANPGAVGHLGEGSKRLTLATKDVFAQLSTAKQPVAPSRLISTLRENYPQFAQQGQGGMYMQQDADEAYSQLVYTMRETLKTASADPLTELMGVDLVTTLKCDGTAEQFTEKQTVYSLKCNITSEVNHLNEGMKIAMHEDREKNSASLNASALWRGDSKVTKLPPALTVQFVRFFWKTNVTHDGTQGMKSKILRKVGFPLVLDMYEFCDETVQAQLSEVRKDQIEAEDKRMKEAEAKKQRIANGEGASGGDVAMADTADAAMDAPKRVTGHYDLIAVLTHKGRAADSGHYISYVKRETGEWVSLDDETLSVKKEDDIKALSGGGDHHMAYLVMYKQRTI
mmetsp:Transcript_19100/g.41817  ORF Transcript_19100/g.41817 Transcript_19100/m.41817 type:complete len:482 (-) Transcript_19100:109-1554(-)|eukprot:CAMPEP_0118930736 /NCGR_PEP_ID=MMETSP1169-20130426/7324_1 /TAXON_ID=36882 /ORGANISM="Pyramimonas obovata, Strain CCMP722" /LENGTH=481 /DNA_ID=CAMNT_0006873139 /DNA_START=122 /DNA_END=1567 /DNA_ORIENTATION=+